MTDYRSKQLLNTTSPVPFRGAAPATPRKSSKLKQSSIFGAATRLGFGDRMDEIFGHANASVTEAPVREEFDKYTSGVLSPKDTDIIHFWEVSFPYAI
jgi:hypothetical protein